jgi:hypothetical protein
VSINNSGSFNMRGGDISGNNATLSPYWSYGGGVYMIDGTFIMDGGIISGNTTSGPSSYDAGGGVYIISGTFKKTPVTNGSNSGIIYGSDAVGNDANGVPLKNTAITGAAVCYSSSKKRNTSAGQTDYIDTTNGLGLNSSGNPPF